MNEYHIALIIVGIIFSIKWIIEAFIETYEQENSNESNTTKGKPSTKPPEGAGPKGQADPK